jgi:hypothetical protein
MIDDSCYYIAHIPLPIERITDSANTPFYGFVQPMMNSTTTSTTNHFCFRGLDKPAVQPVTTNQFCFKGFTKPANQFCFNGFTKPAVQPAVQPPQQPPATTNQFCFNGFTKPAVQATQQPPATTNQFCFNGFTKPAVQPAVQPPQQPPATTNQFCFNGFTKPAVQPAVQATQQPPATTNQFCFQPIQQSTIILTKNKFCYRGFTQPTPPSTPTPPSSLTPPSSPVTQVVPSATQEPQVPPSAIQDMSIDDMINMISDRLKNINLNGPILNISEKIIDKINDNKFLVKISFRELMIHATPIVFKRDLDKAKVDEIYKTIVDGYEIPYTIDAIYDKKANIEDGSIKIINGNHIYSAISKYIENDKHFNCDYKVYVWIYAVDECETTNVKKSIELYSKINNNLPFKEKVLFVGNHRTTELIPHK